MFDNEADELTDALTDNNAPLTWSEAADAIGGGIQADVALEDIAVTDDDDDELIVGVNGEVLVTEETEETDEAEDAEEDAETAETDADTEADERPAADDGTAVEAVTSVSESADPEGTPWYDLAGLRVTVDPQRQVVGERTGEEYENLAILDNGREDVPQPDTEYIPTKIGDGRDSEETIGRLMGQLNYPVLLEGEAGTGKNTAYENFGAKTNRPVNRMDFGDDVTIFDLVGEKDIVDGSSVYILGDLAKSVLFGHMFVADEVSMAEGDVTAQLHAITEGVGKRRLSLRGTGRTLRDLPVTDDELDAADGDRLDAIRAKWDDDKHLGKYIHPEFKFLATTNPLSYAGTASMNGAFRSRFATLELDYLEPKYETRLLADKTGIDQDSAKKLTRLANALRAAHENNELGCPITFRELSKTAELAGPDEEFMNLKTAAKLVFEGHASLKQDKTTISDKIQEEL